MTGARPIAAVAAAFLAAALGLSAEAAPPRRVVSMNLCTDQLAMMLAAPGQLLSVSYLARDPASSAMVAEANRLPVNRGQAEEIFLLRPDLVLASVYSSRSTLEMLESLGVPVEVFPAAEDIEAIRDSTLRMGRVLGRDEAARQMVARLDEGLAGLAREPAGPRPRAGLYAANGYTSASDSLAGRIVALAGFDNIADEVGLEQGGTLPLETLVMAAPDLIVEGRRHAGHSRAEEPLDHPALKALGGRSAGAVLSDPDWVCGTPHVLRAISALRDARPEPEER